MKNNLIVSIVIATFNSSKTLPLVLSSISKQTFPKKNMEIVIIDGGSTDSTLTIAHEYNCRIVNNPKVEPLYAKFLGYSLAKGKYIMYLDHDEVLMNIQSLERRVSLLIENPEIKVVTSSGYYSPPGFNVINRYINEFGDSFSFFMYRLSKNANFFIKIMKTRYRIVKETKDYLILDLSSSKKIALIELDAGGGMMDRDYIKEKFPIMMKQYHLIGHILNLLRSTCPGIAIVKNDALIHYSSDSFNSYLQKIIWRVKNNIYYTETIGASGFAGREKYQSKLMRIKKYLFIFYAYSLVFPLIDAIYLIVTRRDVSYIIHFPLTLITSTLILYYTFLYLMGVQLPLMSYDGSVRGYERNEKQRVS